jgi:DNA helicase HerA-like ATPase
VRVVAVLGMAQTGKTTLALKLLLRKLDVARLVVLDPVRTKPLRRLEPQVLVVECKTWKDTASFLSGPAGAAERWVVAVRAQEMAEYAEVLRCAPFYRHVTLLVDEALTFAEAKETRDYLVKVARANSHFGDGLGVPLWLTAQRPMDLPTDIRSQVSQWVSFRQEEPADLDLLAKRCSRDFAAQVAGLGPHEWVAYPRRLKPQRRPAESTDREADGDSGRDDRSSAPAGADRGHPEVGPEGLRPGAVEADAVAVPPVNPELAGLGQET